MAKLKDLHEPPVGKRTAQPANADGFEYHVPPRAERTFLLPSEQDERTFLLPIELERQRFIDSAAIALHAHAPGVRGHFAKAARLWDERKEWLKTEK